MIKEKKPDPSKIQQIKLFFAKRPDFPIFAIPKKPAVGGLIIQAMANHKSSLKRIRNSESKRTRNRYQAKTMRNAIKGFRELKDKTEASKQLPKLSSMLDRLAKTNVIHKNKASNLKSELAVFINHLK